MRYRFDQFELDTERFVLLAGGGEVHLEPLAFDLLRYLTENAGQILSREAVIDRVWKGRIVSDATVASCIKAVRKALGDTGRSQRYIRTIRGRGIRFDAAVERLAASPQSIAPGEILDRPRGEHEGVAPSQAGPPSIAVLPFFPLADDARIGLLGDALAQEVIHELARLHWLFVISRGSSFQYRGQEVDLRTAGSVLGATYLLTGTILQQAGRCVVAVELTHAVDNAVVWAERFEARTVELVHLRSTLASEIAAALEPRIQRNEIVRAAAAATEDLDAWSAYHRGLSHMFRFNPEDNGRAAELFSRAVELDPAFARAHAGLSFTHFQNAFLGFAPDLAKERRLTRAFAEKSMELDPLDPFANLTMGRAEWLVGELDLSHAWLERAIALRPNYAFAVYNSALVGTLLGDGAGNEGKITRAIALSPIDPLNYAMLATRAFTHVVRNDFKSAAEWAARAVRSPNAHVQIYAIAAFTHELTGERDKADAYVAHIRRAHPRYKRSDFLKSFPLRVAKIEREVEQSLQRLGL